MASTLCLIILAIMSFFFVTELLPPVVTSISGAVAVGLFGLVPVKDERLRYAELAGIGSGGAGLEGGGTLFAQQRLALG